MEPVVTLISNPDGTITQRTDRVISRQDILDELANQETRLATVSAQRSATLAKLSDFDALTPMATAPIVDSTSNEPQVTAPVNGVATLSGQAATPTVDLNVIPGQ